MPFGLTPLVPRKPTVVSGGGSLLPSATANADGSLSFPAGTATPGTTVTFFIEGASVGTATVAADGSAVLTNPLYPGQTGAAISYNALKSAPALSAPAPNLPPYSTVGVNLLTVSNDLTAWSKTGVTTSNLDAASGQIVLGATSQNNSAIVNGLSLPIGTYTIGATVVRTAGTGSLLAKAFFPAYGTASNPTITTGTPYRTSATFTVTSGTLGTSAVQNIALSGTLADGSTYSTNSTFTVYNICLSVGSADAFTAADAPRLVPFKAAPVDYTTQYRTTPNWPTAVPFTKADATPTGCSLLPGAVNVAYYDYTKNGNCNTRELILAHHFISSVNPGYPPNIRQTVNTGNAYDGVDGAISYARMRTFPKKHVYDLIKVQDNGVYLDVVGEKNDTKPYKYPTSTSSFVYAGYLRPQLILRPGMTLEGLIQSPSDIEGWGPFWALGMVQISPGRVPASNGDPLFGFQANPDGTVPGGFTPGPVQTDQGNPYQLFYQLAHKGKIVYGEFDIPDAWCDTSNNPAYNGRTMSAGIVNGAVSVDEVDTAYHFYYANSNGYTYAFPNHYPYKTGGTSLNEAVHSFILNWRNDGSNIVDFICDGVLFSQGYKEFYASNFWNILTHQFEQLGMMVMIGGQYGRGFANQNPITPDGGTKGLLLAGFRAWTGNIDMSTVVIPTNGLSPYPAVSLSNTSATSGNSWTSTVTNVQATDTRIRATSSDGTVIAVTGSGTTRTLTATFANTGTPTVSVKQIPYKDGTNGSIAIGVPTTNTFPISVVAPAALNELTITPTSVNSGTPYNGTASTTTTGSTLSVVSSDGATMAVTGSGASRSVKTTWFAGGTKNLTPTETLTGAPNSPKTSAASVITVLADTPTGSNLVTTPNDFTFWSQSGLIATTGQADSDGTSNATLLAPTTSNVIHRFSKQISGLDNTKLHEFQIIVKRQGTGPGSRYPYINCNAMGQVVFDLQTLLATTSSGQSVPSAGYFITKLADPFYMISLRGMPAASNFVSLGLQNAFSTNDSTSDGIYVGDGTSGLIVYKAFFGRVV
jgi:hypothetical protein